MRRRPVLIKIDESTIAGILSTNGEIEADVTATGVFLRILESDDTERKSRLAAALLALHEATV